MMAALEVFFSYAHEDEVWCKRIETSLVGLVRRDLIRIWLDRDIQPGVEWAAEIKERLETSPIIVLLISPDFIASDYCWKTEMPRAIERHQEGSARVIPIIVRPADWKKTPLHDLQVLPRNGKALSLWPDTDTALQNITEAIGAIVEELLPSQSTTSSDAVQSPASTQQVETQETPGAWNVPLRRNPFFTGREEILSRLREMLTQEQKTALGQPAAVNGMGGVGKTQTAVEYAYRYRESYSSVLWVNANTREEMLENLAALAKLLDLPEQNAQQQGVAVEAIQRWLATHSGWLLIFDNADDLKMVKDYLPASKQGHVLLTTRAQTTSGIVRKIEVETMDLEEGATLLLRRAGLISEGGTLAEVSEEQQRHAKDIVDLLDGLPLALDQAGAYIEETGESLAGYKPLYRQQRGELLRERGGIDADHVPVATTWTMALKKIEQSQPATLELMRFCAFLDPAAIPEELLTNTIDTSNATSTANVVSTVVGLPPLLSQIANDRIAFNRILAALRNYSLIKRNQQTASIRIHRLVQAVIHDEMDEEQQQVYAEQVVQRVCLLFPFNETPPWPISQRLLPHAVLCVEYIGQWGMTFYEALGLLNRIGIYFFRRGQYDEATYPLTKALAVREQVLGNEHLDTAQSLSGLAILCSEQERYEQAEPLYQRALAIYKQKLGEEHPDTMMILNNLAVLYHNKGSYELAESLYRRALAIREQVLGTEHPDTADSLNNLAILYYDRRHYELAEPLYRRALAIYEQMLGAEHPNTATSLNNLAALYHDQERYEQAEPLYQRALASRERLLGVEHPLTVRTRKNYDELQAKMREREDADGDEGGEEGRG